MKEKDFQAYFKEINDIVGVFELKLCKADAKGKLPPLAFNRLAEHQERALSDVSGHVGLYHKISDSFIGDKSGERRFPSAKPFDCFYLKNTPAYVVICYWIPRRLKQFVYIDILDFINERNLSTRKSLTHEKALKIRTYTRIG